MTDSSTASIERRSVEHRDLRIAGLIGTAIALSVLWLAAAIWQNAPFGPSAVAEAVIRLTPGGIATFLIENLHSWARRLLTLGAVGASALAGIEALVRSRAADGTPRPRMAGAILAVLAAGAAFAAPTTDPNPFLVALAVVVAGGAYVVATGRVLGALESARQGSNEDRRRVLRAGALAALGIAGGGTVLGWVVKAVTGGPNTDVNLVMPSAPASIPDRGDFPEIQGLSPEITSVPDHYVVDINLVQPAVEADGWHLSVFGAVDRELDLTFGQLQRQFEVVQEYSVLCCVSNEVGGELIGNSAWGGVRLADVLRAAGVQDDVADVVFRAADGYSDSIPIEVALEPHVLVAVSQNDRPLTQEHGFPCRVRIPSIYGMKNVKWLMSIELVTSDYTGYWQERGWSDDAVVRTQSRIDVAGEAGAARSGEETWIAGVAWAGNRGISKVEVSTDGGATWNEAQLKAPISEFTWTQWAYRWTPSGSGDAEVVCRATDGNGDTQTDDVAPPHPAGATGYHSVSVQIS